MTVYCVDPSSASEASPYDTWAKAAHSIKTVLAIPPGPADVIYCRGTETITGAEIDCASSGTYDGGYIKVIGCNASGAVDGTRYVIDGNNGDFDMWDFAGYDMWWLENIEVKNNGGTGQNGFYSSASSSSGIVFINCCANDVTGSGFVFTNLAQPTAIRCLSYANGVYGFSSAGRLFFCAAHTNTNSGFTDNGIYIACVAHDNGDDGFEHTGSAQTHFACVVDANDDDGIVEPSVTSLYSMLAIGCRITNQVDDGILNNSRGIITGWCYFKGNQDDVNDETNVMYEPVNSLTSYDALTGTPTETNIYDATDDDEGYAAQDTHDFNLNSDALLRRTAITIPWS